MEQLYRWVKASERLPEKENKEYGGKYIIRYFSLGEIQIWTILEIADHQNAGYVFEWLEPIEESGQDEAKKYVKEILKTTWTAETFFKILSSKYHLIKK